MTNCYRITCCMLLFSTLGLTLHAQPGPAEIETMLENFLSDEGVPAIVACTVKDNEITWAGAFGLANIETGLAATIDTPFMLASTSKTITGAALQHALHSYGISRDDAINDHLAFEVNHPSSAEAITFQMLLTHTAAIRDNWDVMPYCEGDCNTVLAEFIEDYYTPGSPIYSATSNFYNYAPGSQYNYSNMGIALAGHCVEAITGMGFDAYCESKFFGPLCMDNTHWFLNQFDDISQVAMPYYTWNEPAPFPVGHYGYPDYPDGQLRSSARDMGHWMTMWLSDGMFGDVQAMPQTEVSDALGIQFGSDQGLVWYQESIGGGMVWMHNGGDQGTTSDLVIEPSTGSGFVLISNGESFHDEMLDTMMEFARAMEADGTGIPECATVGLASQQGHSTLSVNPNPSLGSATLTGIEAGTRLSVYSADGRLIEEAIATASEHHFTGYAPGFYLIRYSASNSVRWVVH